MIFEAPIDPFESHRYFQCTLDYDAVVKLLNDPYPQSFLSMQKALDEAAVQKLMNDFHYKPLLPFKGKRTVLIREIQSATVDTEVVVRIEAYLV